jgi:MFS family permease
MRTWLVAFWAFITVQNQGSVPLGALAVSVIVSLLALPASVMGNEAAIRFGRHRAIKSVMMTSAAVAVAIGLCTSASPWLLLGLLLIYGVTVPADSGALTSGMTMAAAPEHRGATMALHSTVGFGLSAAGAWGFGIVLDAAGGPASESGWLAGFALLAVAILLGPLALWWSRPASLRDHSA